MLLTDFGLPGGMDGIELARVARDRDSSLRVLFVSGFSDGFPGDSAEPERGIRFLAKPYDQAVFARSVRVALGQDPRAAVDPVDGAA